MNALTWPADKAICYGVACAVHANCARYAAVEGNSNEAQRKQGRCEERAGYIPIATVTGHPPGMLQDDSRELSKWLASKPDARLHAREAAAAIPIKELTT